MGLSWCSVWGGRGLRLPSAKSTLKVSYSYPIGTLSKEHGTSRLNITLVYPMNLVHASVESHYPTNGRRGYVQPPVTRVGVPFFQSGWNLGGLCPMSVANVKTRTKEPTP